MSGGKLFPHVPGKKKYEDKDLGIDRGNVVEIKKNMTPEKAELIEKAKQLHGEDKQVSKIARAMRKNSKKPPNGKKNSADKQYDAESNGPQRKTFHLKDLKEVDPMTDHQTETFDLWESGKHLLLSGCAGTGKTFLGVYLSLLDVLEPELEAKKLIIVRSAVPSRDMGFLPGSEEEKTAVFEVPYMNIFNELFHYKNTYENMKEAGLIEFMTTSYLRGLTFNNAIILVDECQNMRFSEINTVMTRVGKNSRIIFAGDYAQNDLTQKANDVTGIRDLIQLVNANYLPSMSIVHFNENDIVRSGLVREWIMACNKAGYTTER